MSRIPRKVSLGFFGIFLILFETYGLGEVSSANEHFLIELARHNQMKGVTCIYVNQRSRESWDTYEMAGGIGLAHNLDGTIIVDYGRVYWQDQQTDLQVKRGEFVRIARVLDCRMCNFKRDRIQIDITEKGLLRPVKSSTKRTHKQ